MKNMQLPKIKTGFSPKQVARQNFGTVKDIKPINHKKAYQGGHSIGWKNPLAK